MYRSNTKELPPTGNVVLFLSTLLALKYIHSTRTSSQCLETVRVLGTDKGMDIIHKMDIIVMDIKSNMYS